jgi:hypothetical protein
LASSAAAFDDALEVAGTRRWRERPVGVVFD